jgi:hypothetical protein
MSGLKKSVIRNMELLIMMVVCFNFYDAMDYMMQTVRKKYCFWCVLYIGDLLQLPPVIRDEEWRTRKLLQRKIFFHSTVTTSALYIELKIFVKLMIRLFL